MEQSQKRSEHTFWEHVFILRRYVFISFATVVAGAITVHVYRERVIEFLFRPMGNTETVFLSPLDPLLFIFKIDFFGGLMIALPVMLLCGYLFVAPAMSIRRFWIGVSFLTASIMLIAAAAAYTLLILVPLSIGFLLSLEVPGITNTFTAQNYLNFVLIQLFMSIAISFIPLATVGATLVHMLNPYAIGRKRGTLYLGITITLAFLTPTTDVYTLLILLVPALVMFETGIIISKIIYSLRQRNTYYAHDTTF